MKDKPLIIAADLPNLIFYHFHKGLEQVNQNIMAFLNLISKKISIICTITPKMKKIIPQQTEWLRIATDLWAWQRLGKTILVDSWK